MKERKFLYVKVKNIHSSSIIPPRNHGYWFIESVKTVGVQQPLIVRPLASSPGEYELIDGGGRADALEPEEEVYVDVRQVSDAQVFRISDATSKLTPRNTCESAAFYAQYVDTVRKEIGEKGALARVATETQLSESELSQYLTIHKLFLKLDTEREMNNGPDFPMLKAMGINKLYKLSEHLENPQLLETAQEIEEKAQKLAHAVPPKKLTLEGINAIVENLQPSEGGIPLAIRDLIEDESAKVTSADSKEESAATNQLKKLTEKITDLANKTNSFVQSIDTAKLPATESTINLLEKMFVCFRRSLSYVNKLKEQKDECQKAK